MAVKSHLTGLTGSTALLLGMNPVDPVNPV
jgi:hypothetical protein